MDDEHLVGLTPRTALIVPTRSLASGLSERVARHQLSLEKSVWVTPTIIVWSDYMRQLWQLNRDALAEEFGVMSLISTSQASLLWSQVIDSSRRGESDLTLLNVQQTTKAVQRSWKLMHDWQIRPSVLKQDHVADTDQFIAWSEGYQAIMKKRGMVDESALLSLLLKGSFKLKHPYSKLILVSYDLVTASQQSYFQNAQVDGVEVSFDHPGITPTSRKFFAYPDSVSEIKAALEHARLCVEQNSDHRVSVVIPDLKNRVNQVAELARDVFYPGMTPLNVEHSDTVYNLGVGNALPDMAAIEAALSVLSLLKNKTSTVDIGFLIRNRFLGLNAQHKQAARLFEQWLKRQRIHSFLFDQLPSLYEQCCEHFAKSDVEIKSLGDESFMQALERLVLQRQSIQQTLSSAKQNSDFSALSFNVWVGLFNDWLDAWQWRTTSNDLQMNSAQYQLRNRWQVLLEEFANLATVQRRAGLNRALELLNQIASNTVFIPKCAASPIVISGFLEAIGSKVDTCIITGMTQEFPSPPAVDAFISNRFLVDAGHPQAKAESGFLHAQSVMKHLMHSANAVRVSYAVSSDTNREIAMQASPLFRNEVFSDLELKQCEQQTDVVEISHLEAYQDTQGSTWSGPGRPKGGSKIFENQSNCAFKAFVTHQLRFIDEREAEFGLDGLDRGNIVHTLLEKIWGELQTQQRLLTLSDSQKTDLIKRVFETVLSENTLKLSYEKLTLLQHERSRLQTLLLNCLSEDAKRPSGFSVVELEEQRIGELSGIEYKYVVDRLDLTDDGRSVIIDYKTGNVNRTDWLGDRIKSPQMPLYALAIDKIKSKPVAGIAFAQVKQSETNYLELSESDIFRKESATSRKRADQWLESRAAWPQIFEKLARDFLAGNASVNPVDKATCQYCELKAMCRVSQLRQDHSSQNVSDEVAL
jgi:probable DNA repair protein